MTIEKNSKDTTITDKQPPRSRDWLAAEVEKLNKLLGATTSTESGAELESDTKTFKASFFPAKRRIDPS